MQTALERGSGVVLFSGPILARAPMSQTAGGIHRRSRQGPTEGERTALDEARIAGRP
jgi:hypothetical protein